MPRLEFVYARCVACSYIDALPIAPNTHDNDIGKDSECLLKTNKSAQAAVCRESRILCIVDYVSVTPIAIIDNNGPPLQAERRRRCLEVRGVTCLFDYGHIVLL